MRGDGYLFQKRGVWYAGYSIDGREQKESLRTRDEEEAGRRFAKLMRGVLAGQLPPATQRRVTVGELLDDLERHLKLKKISSLDKSKSHMKAVRKELGRELAYRLETSRIEAYQEARLDEGRAPATVNRECELLRQAYRLGYYRTPPKVARLPLIPALPVDNARQGFLSWATFQQLLEAIADVDLRDFVEWFMWTAMRPGEIRQLTWQMLDRETWTLHLAPTAAKGTKGKRKGRTIPVAKGPLRDIMERRLARRCVGSPLIFQRASTRYKKAGYPIRSFATAWRQACEAVGLKAGRAVEGGVTPYDLRRSGLRNIIRGGTHERVAMAISGHRTRATFDRYNITATDDMEQAFDRTEIYVKKLRGPKVEKIDGTSGGGNRTD
ncbi:MAG TPA: site-specific integrase [Actinomycetes bacterium]|nr:site-specific integrase [Actinomycetes bacterium]